MYVTSTPEAAQARRNRQDSKDTCRGINLSTGEPCRNRLSNKPSAPTSGLITRIDGQKAYYCWRHKEQAKDGGLQHVKQSDTATAAAAKVAGPQKRASMDGLVERVQAMALSNATAGGGAGGDDYGVKKDGLGGGGPVISVTAVPPETGQQWHDAAEVIVQQQQQPATVTIHHHHHYHHSAPSVEMPPRVSHQKHKVITLLTGLFNRIPFSTSVTHKLHKRDQELFPDATTSHLAFTQVIPVAVPPPPYSVSPGEKWGRKKFDISPSSAGRKHGGIQQHVGPPLPAMIPGARRPAPSPLAAIQRARMITDSVTSAIPSHLSGPTQERLRRVTSKPFSASDVPGYIYIFSLTNDSPNRPGIESDPSTTSTPRVLMKIGRAVNVQSRLRQHEKQCNYELTLIRYYPHISSSSSHSGSRSPSPPGSDGEVNGVVVHKVPNVHRIERLIHLELQDDAQCYPTELKQKCKVCGKVHQEWFSIEATEEGIKGLDEVVSRWIDWGEYWGTNGRHPTATPDPNTSSAKKKAVKNGGVASLSPHVIVDKRSRTSSPSKLGVTTTATTGRRRANSAMAMHTSATTHITAEVIATETVTTPGGGKRKVAKKLFTAELEAEKTSISTTKKKRAPRASTGNISGRRTPSLVTPKPTHRKKKSLANDDDPFVISDDDGSEDASWSEGTGSDEDDSYDDDDDDLEEEESEERDSDGEVIHKPKQKRRTPKGKGGGVWETRGRVKTTGDMWRGKGGKRAGSA